MMLALWSTAVLMAILAAGPSTGEPAPPAEPDAAKQAAATYASLFGEREASARRSRDTTDDLALAQFLVETVATLGDKNPELQRVMMEKAFDLAKSSRPGHATAAAALDRLDALAPSDAATWQARRVEMLATAYQQSTRDERLADTGPSYLNALIAHADALLEAGQATEAVATYQRAIIIAAQVRDLDTRTKLQDSIIVARPAIVLERKITILAARLERDAQDTEAAHELAMIFLLELGNTTKAKSYADQAGDPKLVEHITRLSVPPSVWKVPVLVETAQWLRQAATAWPSDVGKRRGLEQALSMFKDVAGRDDLTAAEQIRSKLALSEIPPILAKLNHVEMPKPVGSAKVKLAEGLILTLMDRRGESAIARRIATMDRRGRIKAVPGGEDDSALPSGRYDGFIIVPATGAYQFRLHMRADIVIKINGEDVSGSIRQETGVTLRLQKGPVPFVLQYQNVRGKRHFLKWLKPGEKELSLVPRDAFAHDANAASRLKMGTFAAPK